MTITNEQVEGQAAAAPEVGLRRLGFFSYLTGPGPQAETYERTIELISIAEELGFDTVWVAQHHFGSNGGLPSPFVFLAAAAARTTRIHLGTALVVLPLEAPLRVAEDAAVLDLLSSGRLELGFGTGSSEAPLFTAFGRDVERRRDLYAEGLETVQRAFEGRAAAGTDLLLHPQAPGLRQRLWEGTFSEEGARGIGSRGNGLLLSRVAWGPNSAETGQEQLPVATAYRQASEAAGVTPRIAISRSVYAAGDRRQAIEELREGVLEFSEGFSRRGMLPPNLSLDEALVANYLKFGSPEDVVESLHRDEILPLATDLVCQVDPGKPTFDQTVRALELIAGDVAPALGWKPTRG